MKKIVLCFTLLVLSVLNMGAVVPIDAEHNAFLHNNIGVNDFNDGDYFAAMKEFEIAIQLNPNTQATAVYYNNLGRTYLLIGYPTKAQTCFERAIVQNPLDFNYYQNLVNSFKCSGQLRSKLSQYKAKRDNPLNQIVVGLIYIKLGQVNTGITELDIFCNKEPNLIITKAVRNYINSKASKKY